MRGIVITPKCHYSEVSKLRNAITPEVSKLRNAITPKCQNSENVSVSKFIKYLCHACTPLPQRPSAANSYYNPLAVRVHPPVPTFGNRAL